MRKFIMTCLVLFFITSCQDSQEIKVKIAQQPKTFCNPLNLSYRYKIVEGVEGVREAADPVVISFDGTYYLFASKSSGYWYSDNFINWEFVYIPQSSVLPIEDYAPALFVHGGYLYYVASTTGKALLCRSKNPEKGEWEAVREIWSYWDPAFYVEGDNLYLYYGCSPETPIYAKVLDLNTFEEKSEVIDCLNSHIENYGWERTGEHNELPLTRRPFIEGAWMTKHGDNYYLQYATPGTEWKSYADGTYVSKSPLGPFIYMENSPVSYKPTGFMGGAGHGSLFTVGQNYWKAATNSISVRHMFERRLSFYPAGFDKDGYLYTNTYLGDYPQFIPSEKGITQEDNRPGWMLLSYQKPVQVSSVLDEAHSAEKAVDEESRTSWVAKTNNTSEWMRLDLEHPCQIQAIQINFDEEGSVLKGRQPGIYQSYMLYASHDGEHWSVIVNNSTKKSDTPHDYIEFEEPFIAQYIKLENKGYTSAPYFSVRDLRIFGNGMGEKPQPVSKLIIDRNEVDPCKVKLEWDKVDNAQGYIIRYGIAKDKLYNNFEVADKTFLEIGSLNRGTSYYFTVDTYNENGVTRSSVLGMCE